LRLFTVVKSSKRFYKILSKNYFTHQQKFESKSKSFLNRFRDKSAMDQKSFLGDLLLKTFGAPTYIKRLKIIDIKMNDKILDVGCGKGILLHKMRNPDSNLFWVSIRLLMKQLFTKTV
jgi:2-polyprenyl-3-methyl-5-hydroxy-6-metoxy-1,4-benzoquinol methylase